MLVKPAYIAADAHASPLVAPPPAAAHDPQGDDACHARRVRKLMQHLPKDHSSRSTWQHIAAEIDKAAAGADTADVSIALRIVLVLEHVEYRLR